LKENTHVLTVDAPTSKENGHSKVSPQTKKTLQLLSRVEKKVPVVLVAVALTNIDGLTLPTCFQT